MAATSMVMSPVALPKRCVRLEDSLDAPRNQSARLANDPFLHIGTHRALNALFSSSRLLVAGSSRK